MAGFNFKIFKNHPRLTKWCGLIVLILLTLGLGIFVGKNYSKISLKKQPLSVRKINDKHIAFLFEVYDTIKSNYWDKISDEQLVNLYVLGTEKLTGKKQEIKVKDEQNLQGLLSNNLKEIKDEAKKNEFTSQLADIVLANLQPFGRSRLYSQKQEVDLKNQVENKNPEVDQYKVLDVTRDAKPEDLKKAFNQKTVELKKDQSPEAKQQLTQVTKAYEILSDKDNKKTYDQSGVEPTMEYKLVTPDIFYLHINKFSPTTIEELVRITQKVDNEPGPNTLILDLRDNVGGAIDGLPYFLGPFIGNDQYAYQFYHQGNKEDFKTKIGWLPSLIRYKKVVTVINDGTQSSAEVMAAVLKKYNVGVVIGTPTKGWGTVEKVFPLNQQIDVNTKYSVFLVHSLTLREDGQPIEGKKVEPVINITDPSWEKQLYNYFRYNELAKAIKEVLK